jgi:hypothetical protein
MLLENTTAIPRVNRDKMVEKAAHSLLFETQRMVANSLEPVSLVLSAYRQ